MPLLDWIVIGLYALAMLAIGWYTSRDTASAEDFLLGGRRMNPILVGLSLFATLVSSLSYLAVPGEIIGHGPFLFFQVCAYPFVVLIVGWGLIPYIMRQPVTSAYELLEKRLGSNVRFCAAMIFLLLRLGWMAAILYATCSTFLLKLLGLEGTVVTIPGLQLETTAVPWLCLVMGLITVIYASSGGIKAVVLTDATQSLIMIAGAIGTIVVISIRVGGVSAWWPDHWYGHWDPANIISRSDRSFLVVMINALCWYVSTAGADQMAVQRYLSTRDVGTARRTLKISMCTDMLVLGLLTLVGIAILGYFRIRDSSLPTGQNLLEIADKLFPRFVTQELPTGLRGLVIVAILAAAMSSLSSGVNSSCAVLKEDVLGRFRIFRPWLARPVRLVRWLSFGIGISAVLLSLLLTLVPGNLLDLCYKVVNLLAAPIFVLFFLALFIPWATPSGAFAGLFASVATAMSIAHFQAFELAIFWMTPAALTVGIATGVTVSAASRAILPNHAPPSS